MGPREPDGGTDLHRFIARGENAELSLRVGPETGFTSEMVLRPRDQTGLGPAIEQWGAAFPGLEVRERDDGYLLVPPPSAATRHEAQFPRVLDRFLTLLEMDAWPSELMARIRTRYTLLARAREMALVG